MSMNTPTAKRMHVSGHEDSLLRAGESLSYFSRIIDSAACDFYSLSFHPRTRAGLGSGRVEVDRRVTHSAKGHGSCLIPAHPYPPDYPPLVGTY
jgi:hypothetical protein